MKPSQEIIDWLISDGRELGDGEAIVDGYISRLVAAGVPVRRANIAQRFANPLLIAWGVVWTPEGSSTYDVTHETLGTDSYVGSPFEIVRRTGQPLHKSLRNLNLKTEHKSYLELAEAGGTDIYANQLAFGDGSKNGCTYVTNDPDGFSPEHIQLIQDCEHALACAMEPVTMRRSTRSLLRTYLGNGPAAAVTEGSIIRGGHTSTEAVLIFTDLRGFTASTEAWSDTKLLRALDGYFDVVVSAVEENGGDVLKFMGDGVLCVFTIDAQNSHKAQCRNAVSAAKSTLTGLQELNEKRALSSEEPLSIGIGINMGSVTYGNIGSPGRLDFTVLGSAVNVASRVQDLCKTIDVAVLATEQIAIHCSEEFEEKGSHPVKGVTQPIKVFALK